MKSKMPRESHNHAVDTMPGVSLALCARYILEKMVNKIEEEASTAVRLQILTTAMKLFFARPPECQKTLGALFEKMIDDDSHMDVHDRALLYYRLLKTNVEEARRVVACPKETLSDFSERHAVVIEKVFEEFNSLSCVYGAPAETFVDQTPPYNTVGLARARFSSFGGSGAAAAAARAAAVARAGAASGGGGGSGAQIGNLLDVGAFTDASSGDRDLSAAAAMNPADFEKKWTSSEISLQIKDLLQSVPSTEDFERLMTNANIKTLAMMPPQNGLLKYFLYAQEIASGNYHLIEVVVEIPTRCLSCSLRVSRQRSKFKCALAVYRCLTASFKCDEPNDAPDFAVAFRAALSGSMS